MKLEINENNMIRVLRDTFSKNTNMFVELIQNARRAGATKIDIITSVAEKKVTFTDNGNGIEDFQTLLTLAESGYDEETINSEQPFGLGFLSAIFKARRIDVFSGDKKIAFYTADLLNGKAIGEPITTDKTVNGTKVVIYFTGSISKIIPTRVDVTLKYFPVDVVIDGTLIPKYIVPKEYEVQTDIGVVDTTRIQGKEPLVVSSNLTHVYQYMRIDPSSAGHSFFWNSGSYNTHNTLSVYLKNHYRARMPERDYLLVGPTRGETELAIYTALLHVAVQDRAKFTNEEFVTKWYMFTHKLHTRSADAHEILNTIKCMFNDIDLIDSSILEHIDYELPELDLDNDSIRVKSPVLLLSKKELEEQGAIIITEVDRSDRSHNVDLCLAQELDVYTISKETLELKVHKDHWLRNLTESLPDDLINSVRSTVAKEGDYFSAGYSSKRVVICTTPSIMFQGKKVDLSSYTVITYDNIIITSDNYSPVDITRFLDTCNDEVDMFQEYLLDAYVDELNTIINKLKFSSVIEYNIHMMRKHARETFNRDVAFTYENGVLSFFIEETDDDTD